MYQLLAFTLLAPAAAFQPADTHALERALDECCRNPNNGEVDQMGIFDNDCKVTSSGLYSSTGTHIKDWDTSLITDMSYLFKRDGNCPEETINANISQWDTSRVTNMFSLFHGAELFNQPLPWDTSNVTDMSYIFSGAKIFNQPLLWDTSKVTVMTYGFAGAEVFNQPLPWDTSQVTNMYGMFQGAKAFNQLLTWDTSKVTDMSYIFYGAYLFSRPLYWDTSSLQHAENMFIKFENDTTIGDWNTFASQVCDLTSATHQELVQEITKPTRTTAYQQAGLCKL